MLCPRCKLLMRLDDYEGQNVHFCGNCWGHWTTKSALEKILHTTDYSFSERELQTTFQRWIDRARKDTVELIGETIHCPECKDVLKRRRFLEECPVIVDICETHGVWLDTGEIKELQIFYEQKGSK